MEKKILVELKHVSKRFAKVLANDDVSAKLWTESEISARLFDRSPPASSVMAKPTLSAEATSSRRGESRSIDACVCLACISCLLGILPGAPVCLP